MLLGRVGRNLSGTDDVRRERDIRMRRLALNNQIQRTASARETVLVLVLTKRIYTLVMRPII